MAMSNDDRWMRDSTGSWIKDIALLRIGPETEIVAAQIAPGIYHPIGCVCPDCAEVRRAVGKMRGRDRHIAGLADIREQGRTAARREILAQEYREAAARAEVTRELAGYGVYPYRTAREAAQEFLDGTVPPAGSGDCTCPPGSGRRESPYWHSHYLNCPMRARLRAQAGSSPRKEREGDLLPDPPLTPEQEIRAALAAYDAWMLHGPQMPSWMEPASISAEPGRCRECHLGHAPENGGLCTYCLLRTHVTRVNLEHMKLAGGRHRIPASHVLMLAMLGVIFWILVALIATGALG